MATIGRAAAVAQLGRLKLHGFTAWMAWLFIHLLALIGFRNRVVVLLEWAWSYLTWQRGARLITGEVGARIAVPGRVLGSPDTAGSIHEPAPVQPPSTPEVGGGGWMEGDPVQGRGERSPSPGGPGGG